MDLLGKEKTGKNYKVFGIRGSLIGDNIMALPLLTLIDKYRPDCYKYWQVAKKERKWFLYC